MPGLLPVSMPLFPAASGSGGATPVSRVCPRSYDSEEANMVELEAPFAGKKSSGITEDPSSSASRCAPKETRMLVSDDRQEIEEPEDLRASPKAGGMSAQVNPEMQECGSGNSAETVSSSSVRGGDQGTMKRTHPEPVIARKEMIA